MLQTERRRNHARWRARMREAVQRPYLIKELERDYRSQTSICLRDLSVLELHKVWEEGVVPSRADLIRSLERFAKALQGNTTIQRLDVSERIQDILVEVSRAGCPERIEKSASFDHRHGDPRCADPTGSLSR